MESRGAALPTPLFDARAHPLGCTRVKEPGYEVPGLDRAGRRRDVCGGGAVPTRLHLSGTDQRRSRRERQRSYRSVSGEPGGSWRPHSAADHRRGGRGSRVSVLPRVSEREVVKALQSVPHRLPQQPQASEVQAMRPVDQGMLAAHAPAKVAWGMSCTMNIRARCRTRLRRAETGGDHGRDSASLQQGGVCPARRRDLRARYPLPTRAGRRGQVRRHRHRDRRLRGGSGRDRRLGPPARPTPRRAGVAQAGWLSVRASLRCASQSDSDIITGTVNAYREAVVRVVVRGSQGQEQEIEAIIDTGFNGSLSLPPMLVAALGLPFRRRGRALLADGSEGLFDVHEATVVWDGQPRRVSTDTADTDPLVGMALLEGYELTVQAVDGGSVFIKALATGGSER